MLLRHFPAVLVSAALLAACNSNPQTAKTAEAPTSATQPDTAATASPPAVSTSASAKSLISVATSDTIWNGIAVADNDRKFVLFPHNEGDPGTRVGELLADGKVKPYPNRYWNSWTHGDAAAGKKIVRANSLRFGPDGLLWVVDTGTPKSDAAPVPGGPKLLAFNIQTNQLVKQIPLDDYVKNNSFIDDLRFHHDLIYVTDAGAPGIIIINQKTGHGRRVLDGDSSVTVRRPMIGEGKPMLKPTGEPVKIHADQQEVSPDGKYYYYQTAAGPMYRLETKCLDDPAVPATELAKQVTYFFNSPTCGGTCIDAAGNLYVCDAIQKRILKVTPDGQSSTLVQDPRLVWADALWIDHAGNLWIPVPQMNRTAGFNKGVDAVEYPVQLFKLPIGARPFRN